MVCVGQVGQADLGVTELLVEHSLPSPLDALSVTSAFPRALLGDRASA